MEIEEFRKHNVYLKVPIEECYQVTGKGPLGLKWIDINKGDDECEQYKSRLVAKEIKFDKREDLFAPTPPLESIKMLLSLAVTEGAGYLKHQKLSGMKLDFIDVKNAYLHARARRDVYVKLPDEDYEAGMVGKLLKSMYGTRDAAQNWEFEYRDFMETERIIVGKSTPCAFRHPERKLRVVIHGDDFTVLGHAAELDWFRAHIVKNFEVKFKARLGPEDSDDQAVRILNRVVEWTDEGIRYEADQRHAEIIIHSLGLQGESRTLSVPGEKRKAGEEEEDEPEKINPRHPKDNAVALPTQQMIDYKKKLKAAGRKPEKQKRAPPEQHFDDCGEKLEIDLEILAHSGIVLRV